MTMVSSYPVISSSLDYSPACLPPMEPVSSYPPTTRPTTSDLVEMTPPTWPCWSTPTDYTPQSTPFATPVEAVEALSGKPNTYN